MVSIEPADTLRLTQSTYLNLTGAFMASYTNQSYHYNLLHTRSVARNPFVHLKS